MKVDIYAFSSSGAKLCAEIIENMKEDLVEAFVPEKYANSAKYVKVRAYNLYKSTEKSFETADCIIFIGAAGIAVRAIAPFVRSKKTDPAVICMDERGINVISLLSGHIGGANRITHQIALMVGGNPIITTATDINDKFAVDEWATRKNLHIMSLKKARDMAAYILENEKIGLISDFDVRGELPQEFDRNEKNKGICISYNSNKKPFENTLNLIPKNISVGVGCRKDARYEDIYEAIKTVLSNNNISHFAIRNLNSIDLKKDEKGLIRTAEIFKVPFITYTKDELNTAEGEFTKSDFVKNVAGVDTVCERAALMGNSKQLIITKTIINSVAIAVAREDYTVDFD